jgi:hypothetical protein
VAEDSFSPSRLFEAARLQEGIGDHRHQRVAVIRKVKLDDLFCEAGVLTPNADVVALFRRDGMARKLALVRLRRRSKEAE